LLTLSPFANCSSAVIDDAPEQRAWLKAVDAPAVLTRPDRYVLGAARSLRELNALAATV
jgi:3-(3-hydroxy-phenyl)propionate hydroxylase